MEQINQNEELLREYEQQSQFESEHSFPYVVYSDYSDSGSGCCC